MRGERATTGSVSQRTVSSARHGWVRGVQDMDRQDFVTAVFLGWRGTVLVLSRCPYTVDRGTPNMSAIA